MPGDPFHLDVPPSAPLCRAALAAARPLLEYALDLETYRRLYRRAQLDTDGPFEHRALRVLDITPCVSIEELADIPPSGPLIVAANHPHGLLDGLLLADALRGVRPDVRVLANGLLQRIPELGDLCFFVDPFDRPGAAERSRAGLRAAHMWLRRGGALVIFPAGEVAHRWLPGSARSDSDWKPIAGRMAAATGASVVPAFIDGVNSRLFYLAGRAHPGLRTILLARELLKKRNRRVTVRFGPPLANDDAAAGDARRSTARARSAVERLAGRVAPELRSGDSAAEVARLPRESCLVESGAFQVFCAEARDMPATLDHIGTLREIAYRAVGEGTGRTRDLDRFDARYLHLFLWNRDRQEVAGAYRIGRTDRILAAEGVHGLYTRTLFRYDERFMARLSPALELGRSFVRAEYQKNYSALLLLWKGIGQYVVRHPQYRVLFGPVSISTRYSDASHQLLAAFLDQNHLDRELAELVEATHPRRSRPAPPAPIAIPRSVDEASRLVSQMEQDGKGMPVLLRHYLKLNARLIGFNVDPGFGDALDALMLVDLTTVDSAILSRYLGRQEAAQFLARHRPGVAA